MEPQDPRLENTSEREQPLDAQMWAYMPTRDKYASSILALTDPTNDLQDFELFLRRMRYDSNHELVQAGEPLMNEQGINAVMSTVQSLVHHMATLSNFKENHVNMLMVSMIDTLSRDLMLNRLTYEIDRKNRDIIVDNATRFSYSFVQRAFEEGDRKFWRGSVTEVKHTQETNKIRGSMSLNPFTGFRK